MPITSATPILWDSFSKLMSKVVHCNMFAWARPWSTRQIRRAWKVLRRHSRMHRYRSSEGIQMAREVSYPVSVTKVLCSCWVNGAESAVPLTDISNQGWGYFRWATGPITMTITKFHLIVAELQPRQGKSYPCIWAASPTRLEHWRQVKEARWLVIVMAAYSLFCRLRWHICQFAEWSLLLCGILQEAGMEPVEWSGEFVQRRADVLGLFGYLA